MATIMQLYLAVNSFRTDGRGVVLNGHADFKGDISSRSCCRIHLSVRQEQQVP